MSKGHAKCPWCKLVFETKGEREFVWCPKCESGFPTPESIEIASIKDELKADLLDRAANPRPLRKRDKVTRLHDEAIRRILSTIKGGLYDLNPACLTVDDTEGGFFRFNITAGGYKATATLWKGLLYDPIKLDAQINVHFSNLYIDICIWYHIKGHPIYEGWKRSGLEDKISCWDQMLLDGDVSPEFAAITLAPYQR